MTVVIYQSCVKDITNDIIDSRYLIAPNGEKLLSSIDELRLLLMR